MAVSKRDRLANWLASTGLLRLAERLPQQDCLIVLNYHRIGDRDASAYDPGVFDGTPEALDEHLGFVKKRFRCVGLEEALAFAEGRTSWRGAGVLVTFDDGYLDNYHAAFPCLQAHGIQGLFFLPTSFIATGEAPWWDRIAYMVKNSRRRQFSIGYPAPAEFDLDAEGLDRVLLRLFRTHKAPATTDGARLLAAIAEATGSGEVPRERLFFNWDEARRMLAGGMAFGSHTHTHALLAKLTREQQTEEMALSKRLIEQNLGIRCETLAYPYGLESSFTAETMETARETGYRAAFSYYGGVNRPGATAPRNIYRQPIAETRARFRMRTLMAAVAGTYY
jgi:peptidoglycan/xylan/chitin deacetylase (PgdA/CDA1 family)